MNRVAIIDYGVGNLRSVEKAFAATGCEASISSDESFLRSAERLVLPGVGAFAACMKALEERGFDRLVRERVVAGTPLLGVCVGMQMLFEESEEFGSTRGLCVLKGRVS
jgi:glutamine amidotransferase